MDNKYGLHPDDYAFLLEDAYYNNWSDERLEKEIQKAVEEQKERERKAYSRRLDYLQKEYELGHIELDTLNDFIYGNDYDHI